MTPPTEPVQERQIALPEARFLDRLSLTHARLADEIEPEAENRVDHDVWQYQHDEFREDLDMLKEDLASLFREWEA